MYLPLRRVCLTYWTLCSTQKGSPMTVTCIFFHVGDVILGIVAFFECGHASGVSSPSFVSLFGWSFPTRGSHLVFSGCLAFVSSLEAFQSFSLFDCPEPCTCYVEQVGMCTRPEQKLPALLCRDLFPFPLIVSCS